MKFLTNKDSGASDRANFHFSSRKGWVSLVLLVTLASGCSIEKRCNTPKCLKENPSRCWVEQTCRAIGDKDYSQIEYRRELNKRMLGYEKEKND